MSFEKNKISFDYIRGVVEGEGTFTFSSSKGGRKVPALTIKMHVRNKRLIESIRDVMGLKNTVYVYDHQRNDGSKRQAQAMLIVREIGQLKNIIIPFFHKRLYGNKGLQFNAWLEKIGSDPLVPENFKFIYKLYKSGYYDRAENIKY